MSVITIESKAFKRIMDKLNYVENTVKVIVSNNSQNPLITEDEAVILTGYSKRSLREKRRKGLLDFSTATGRKIKYKRKDIENYLNNNTSTKK
jgi:hypothetical protein